MFLNMEPASVSPICRGGYFAKPCEGQWTSLQRGGRDDNVKGGVFTRGDTRTFSVGVTVTALALRWHVVLPSLARDSGHLCSEAAEMTKFRRDGPRATVEWGGLTLFAKSCEEQALALRLDVVFVTLCAKIKYGKIETAAAIFNPIFCDAWVWHHHS